ncbi:MAG: hypothetical protein V5A44_10535 [Haloarculaceae archaeon]
MAVRTGDDTEYQTVGMDAAELQRYAEVTLESGEVVIYDEENEDAWVQSASAIGLEFMA